MNIYSKTINNRFVVFNSKYYDVTDESLEQFKEWVKMFAKRWHLQIIAEEEYLNYSN